MWTSIKNWFNTPFPPSRPRYAVGAAIFVAVGAECIGALSGDLAEHLIEFLKFIPAYMLKIGLLGALAILVFGFGWKLYQSYVQHHQLLNKKLDEVPEAEVLILPVSEPKRGGEPGPSKFDASVLRLVTNFADDADGNAWLGQRQWSELAKGRPTLEDFCHPDLHVGGADEGHAFGKSFTWQTGFIVTRAILEKNAGGLKAIHLVPSNETSLLAEKYYAPTLALLAGRYLSGKTISMQSKAVPATEYRNHLDKILYIVHHTGVDYSDFEKVQQKVLGIVGAETSMRGPEPVRVVVDVTGGTAAFSAAAAIASTRRNICYSHVPQDDSMTVKPLFYDIVTKEAEFKGPG